MIYIYTYIYVIPGMVGSTWFRLFASPRKSGTGTQVLPPMLLGSWKSRVQNMWLDAFIEAEYGLNRGRIPIEYDFRTHRPVFFLQKKVLFSCLVQNLRVFGRINTMWEGTRGFVEDLGKLEVGFSTL